jgi:hypothetical protein
MAVYLESILKDIVGRHFYFPQPRVVMWDSCGTIILLTGVG